MQHLRSRQKTEVVQSEREVFDGDLAITMGSEKSMMRRRWMKLRLGLRRRKEGEERLRVDRRDENDDGGFTSIHSSSLSIIESERGNRSRKNPGKSKRSWGANGKWGERIDAFDGNMGASSLLMGTEELPFHILYQREDAIGTEECGKIITWLNDTMRPFNSLSGLKCGYNYPHPPPSFILPTLPASLQIYSQPPRLLLTLYCDNLNSFRSLRLHLSMASSILSLSIDKGPKKVESLICVPGTVIGIGRVLRGNTLAIREPGISEKHLTIFFVPEITRWVVTDLGSSNGTYVNGALISPEKPYSLNNSDEVKIGEKTSISVNISVPVVEPFVLPRRGQSSRPPRTVTLVNAEWQDKVDEPSENGQRKRIRRRKGGESTRVLRKDVALESVAAERRVMGASCRKCSDVVSVKKLEEEEEVEIKSNSHFVHVEGNDKQEEGNTNDAEEEVLVAVGEKISRVEKMKDDMSNITLEEWFDRMEEHLPRAINKVAEEIITKLREKARLFDEFKHLPRAINKVAEEIITKLREKA